MSLAGEFVLIPLVDHWSVSLVRLLPTAAAVIGYRFGVTWAFAARWRLVGLVWSESSMSMWLSDGILSLVRGFSYIFLTRDRKKKIKCDSGSREFGNFFGNFVFTPDTTNM